MVDQAPEVAMSFEVKVPGDEARLLRWMLWATHRCPDKSPPRKTGHAGVCTACDIDFANDAPERIYERMAARVLDAVAIHQWDRCARCECQRFTLEALQPCPRATNGVHEWYQTAPDPHAFNAGTEGTLIRCATCGLERGHEAHAVNRGVVQ